MADRLPLAGITVLDCSRVLAGPHATMLLADLGADVWKLEPPAGDETRAWGPPFWGDPSEGRSAYFAAVNRNKRSVVVDLKSERGRDILDRLAARADLLMHNYVPSVATRLGLDPGRLRERHPHLVVSVVRGFPGSGADAERPAYDLVAQAWSGHMAVTGEPESEPIKFGVGLLDLLAGLEAAVSALAGLAARERGIVDRPAAHSSVSLVEAAVAGLSNVLGYHLATGEEPRRWGSGHPDIVPYQVFAAADGHVVVAVGNDDQFERLCSVLGIEPKAEWATNPDRVTRRADVAGRRGPGHCRVAARRAGRGAGRRRRARRSGPRRRGGGRGDATPRARLDHIHRWRLGSGVTHPGRRGAASASPASAAPGRAHRRDPRTGRRDRG